MFLKVHTFQTIVVEEGEKIFGILLHSAEIFVSICFEVEG
jgi:hypothetical protein